MKTSLLRLILLTVVCVAWRAEAQDTLTVMRPVTSSYTVEAGASHLADTYLTPLHYRGTHFGLMYERDQAMSFNPERWIMQLKVGAVLDDTRNPAKNATLLNATFDAGWYMMHRWRLDHGLTVGAGAGASADLGVLYLSRNSNNPASAKCSLTLDATGYAAWSGRVWHVPLTVRYQPTLPLTGGFFSPDYGELYYQIYLGKRGGLLHAAWPGNFLRWDNLLTADLHFGSTSVRVGYHGTVFSSKVNGIVTQNISHAVVIGITTEWISLRPTDRKVCGRIISSY